MLKSSFSGLKYKRLNNFSEKIVEQRSHANHKGRLGKINKNAICDHMTSILLMIHTYQC